jgi:hypothetical protein
MVPKLVDAMLAKYGNNPIALTGCRTTDLALECCEYDYVVIADGQYRDLLEVDGNYAEIHSLPSNANPLQAALYLNNMRIVNDASWVLSTLKQRVNEALPRALDWYARGKITDALLYANSSKEVAGEDAQISSMWLKCAAYCYLEGALAYNGTMPMPTHMLSQLRSMEKTSIEGIGLASTCLGLERANKSSVSRCIEAAVELNDRVKHDYTTKLVSRKARFLYDASMYTDCYFYAGYVASGAIVSMENQRMLKDHMFMISIAMDLTTDQSFQFRLPSELLDACNILLKKRK